MISNDMLTDQIDLNALAENAKRIFRVDYLYKYTVKLIGTIWTMDDNSEKSAEKKMLIKKLLQPALEDF